MRLVTGVPSVGTLVGQEGGEDGEVVGVPLGGGVEMVSCGPADGSDPAVWVHVGGNEPHLTQVRDLRF